MTPITSKNHLNPFHFETSAEPITAGKSSYCFHADISTKSGKVYPSIDVVSCNKKKRKKRNDKKSLAAPLAVKKKVYLSTSRMRRIKLERGRSIGGGLQEETREWVAMTTGCCTKEIVHAMRPCDAADARRTRELDEEQHRERRPIDAPLTSHERVIRRRRRRTPRFLSSFFLFVLFWSSSSSSPPLFEIYTRGSFIDDQPTVLLAIFFLFAVAISG